MFQLNEALSLASKFLILFALIPSSSVAFSLKMSAAAPATNIEHALADLLTPTANSFASANGLLIERKRPDGQDGTYLEGAPISLLPNAFPAAAFQDAVDLAPAFNLLVDRVSRDHQFLSETLASVVEADDFTAKLLEFYLKIYVHGDASVFQYARNADRLGIHRSDYMLHSTTTGAPPSIQQIELNTIASSFASLACQVAKLHSFLLQRYASSGELQAVLQENARAVGSSDSNASGSVPVNPALQTIAASFHATMDRYRQRHTPTKPLVVLFVIQPGESNTVDQRMLEFQLWQQHSLPVVRLSLADIAASCHVDETSGALLYQEESEIGLVYYRAGYTPNDYPTDVEWQARYQLEVSRATKSPSLGYHLAGTKKVQQQLARPDVLEKFFPDDDDETVVKMRKVFAGLYSLSDDITTVDLEAVRDVLNGNYENYVLKPQREGGGYNFYGDDLLAKLQQHVRLGDDDKLQVDRQLAEYILMERLFPPQQQASLLRAGKVEGTGPSISELGCYGTVLVSAQGEVIQNDYAGYLLRTKFSNVNEGGVASGFATLSSPYLC
jgi:glutathione synthetase